MQIHIVADDGELLERIDITKYDMSNPFARSFLTADILKTLDHWKGK